MPDIDKHISIPKNVSTENDLDFSFLRKIGLEHIEQLASSLWTDYNSHDPGVTMLEMLSYAITDLGARINLPLENILAPENNEAKKIEEQFFKATQILPSKPVTELDYRKLFVDIEGVKNCWLKPFDKTVYVDCKKDKLAYKPESLVTNSSNFKLQGLNSVIIDFDALDDNIYPSDILKEKRYNQIKDEIITEYHKNRNLCEDLVDISKVETHAISVCASIDVKSEADEEFVHAKVIRAIDNYFSSSIKFYSLKEMFAKGYTSDEIFEGPVLENGFIDPKELDAARLRTEVRLSDIMQLIMDIDGVNVIKEISISDCNKYNEEPDVWLICVESDKKPMRCKDSAYSYFKGVLPVNINQKKVKKYIIELDAAERSEQEKAGEDMEIEVPTGKYLNTNETTTIQNDFPDTYGIGEFGLPSRVETARKSQAKQLKGYLLFFDQILATYFAHLGKVKDLLSVDNQLKRTYFTQAVNDIKDFEGLVNNYDNNPDILTKNLLTKLDENIKRKNILLDHLIARFAEKFSDYAFLMKELYGSYAEKAIVNSKEIFLSEYGEITETDGKIINKGISNWRGSAFNYYKQESEDLWNTTNIAGVQKRIARLAGIKNYSRHNLSKSFVEIYDLIDSDSNKVYRWRIRNLDNEIILSATEDYKIPGRAEDEMYLAVVKIIETPEKVITNAFNDIVLDEQEIGNFEIQISETNKYSFDVINLAAAPTSTDRVIARQFTYYNSQAELKDAILEIIKFMTTDFTEEGMFVVEHILLRPDVTETDIPLNQFMPICTDDCTSCQPIDPYSFRVTVILPGWTYRFSNPDFRNFLEELIRKEIPAHILVRICWVGYRKNEVEDDQNEMLQFEKAYKDFLLAKTKLGQAQNSSKLKKLIKILNELNSIYPSGRLIDCDDEEDSLEGRIILGRTNIGNL
ncbi:MAG: hypothetical protein HQ522_07285 [Bacteroidetes bacterium]|nr:hypothetical protein [Bacteroidota bacterium]